MATLGKIRSKGPLLIIVIGLALFAFIAGDAWKIFQSHRTADAGEIYGKPLSAMDFQSMLEEYSNIIEISSGSSAMTDEQRAQMQEEVWRTYVNNTIIEHEANALGLTVSDEEMQYILTQGTHPMLRQTPFINQSTGLFDKDMLYKFLTDYTQMDPSQIPFEYMEQYRRMYEYWVFLEKTIRQNRLAEKYQNLISQTILTNSIETEASYNARIHTTDFLLAAVPYTSVPDSEVPLTDSDLKAVYDKRKERFKQTVESRDIKYIDLEIKASAADRAAIEEEVEQAQIKLEEGGDYKAILREAGSEALYSDLYHTKSAYSADVASRLDQLSPGQVAAPYYNSEDNTLNTFKLLASTTEADSVRFRQIQVSRATAQETSELADSIYNALRGGADFATLAAQYGAPAEDQWINTQVYENVPNLDAHTENLFSTVFSMSSNEIRNLELPNGRLILQVLEKKAPVSKYKIALVKKTVTFSKETYSKAYNKLSSFIAANPTVEKMAANAENEGFRLLERRDMYSAEHNVAGVRRTENVLRWIFSAKEGELSQMYECGDNDHLMVVAVTGINKEGYRPFEKVKEELKFEAMRDKRAEKLLSEINGMNINSFAQAANIPNVVTDSLKHVSFARAAYVSATTASEPVLSAWVNAPVDKVTRPIRGTAAIYILQPYNKEKLDETFNKEMESQRIQSLNMQAASRFMNDLYSKAKVKDTRYLYF